jgi:hypothetical protein
MLKQKEISLTVELMPTYKGKPCNYILIPCPLIPC